MSDTKLVVVGATEQPPPSSPISPQTGKSAKEDEILEAAPVKEETESEKKKREAKEKEDALKEWGGKAPLRKLLSLSSCGEKCALALGMLGALGHGAGQPLMCLMFGELIDGLGSTMFTDVSSIPANVTAAELAEFQAAFLEQGNQAMMENVGRIAVQFVAIGFGVLAAASLQGFGFPYFTDSQVAKMRPLYFDVMLHRDVAWFDTHAVGSLPGEMASDLDVFAEGFGNQLGMAFMSMSGLIVGLIVGFYLSWQIALAMLVTLPLMALGAVLMSTAVLDAMKEVQGPYARAAALADEVLFAIRTVVAFGGEAREIQRYSAAADEARKGGFKNRVKTGMGMGYIWLIYFAAMALAFWVAMTLMYDGNQDLTAGKVMSAFTCVLTVGFMIGSIGPGITGVVASQAALARFFYLVKHESEIQRRVHDDRRPASTIESLQLENVAFSYPARPDIQVLSGVSLTIRKGQKVAFVGESGSGKSTIMALLERFYDPQQGAVLVNGVDLRTINIQSYRKQIGYVGQEPVLFATSVRANIMQGCVDASDDDFQKAARNAQLDFVKSLPQDFDTYVGSGGSQFSGGQKQRIAIARALLKKPSVLFLDEATSALDSNSEKMIQQTIDDLGKASELGGMTIVSIAHRLSTVQNSDVIYVLKSGEVVEQGSHSALTAKEGGVYQALAAAQGAVLKRQDSGQAETEEKAPELQTGPSTAQAVAEEDKEDAREKEIMKTYKVPTARLLSFSRSVWCFFAPGFLAALVSGACFPILGAYILTDAIVALMNPDKEVMKEKSEMAAIWFVVFGAIKCLASTIQFASFGIIAEVTTREARVAMLTNVFRQDIGFHDNPENTAGKLVAALKIHAYRISRLLVSFGDQGDALCSVLVGLVMAFVACWQMALAMLGAIPIFAIAQGMQMAVMMGAQKEENGAMKRASQVLSDALLNSRTVQASGNEKDVLKLYSDIVGKLSEKLFRSSVAKGFGFGLSSAVVFWIMSGGFYIMGLLIKDGQATFETGNQAFMGILYGAMGAGMAASLTGNLAKAKVAAHDLFQIIDTQSLINGLEPVGSALQEGHTVGRIEFQAVKFAYPFRPDVQVLKEVSFVLQAGMSAGLVGPSGGGKSTVMAMIQRFYDPSSGAVLIGSNRQPLRDLNIRWWRKQVGFVGQEPILFNASVLENVMYGLEQGEQVSPEHLENCKKMANLNFIDNSKAQGWETQVGPRGSRLSGGQKQRVAICRALVRNPPIL
ncbi:unnamed protein product, partial [Effrenium voratum]